MPIRTCIGCRRRGPASELVRVVWTGEVLLVSRTGPGRGAWLCAGSATCAEAARRRGAFSRALRADVPQAAAAGLVRELGAAEEDGRGPTGA